MVSHTANLTVRPLETHVGAEPYPTKVRAQRLRYRRVLCVGVTMALALTFTTACASHGGCSQGVDSATKAVQHLIDLSRSAKSPADICPAVVLGSTVTAKDLAKLNGTFANEPDQDLTIMKGTQMGTDAEVNVTSKDGQIQERVFAFSDDHTKWTVEFGHFTG